MANKTNPTTVSAEEFIAGVADERKRADSERLIDLMSEITGEPPVMWGPSMVGFGSYHYKYDSGREGDMLRVGFSPRASAISLYIFGANEDRAELLAVLGKHTVGKGCIYIKRLSDVDETALRALIEDGYRKSG